MAEENLSLNNASWEIGNGILKSWEIETQYFVTNIYKFEELIRRWVNFIQISYLCEILEI